MELACAGDRTKQLVDVGCPVEPCMFMQHWVDRCTGCGRWSRVCGVVVNVVFLYPTVPTFLWFVYPITGLHVATGVFVDKPAKVLDP